jgi:small-conductance mechanosensitive channel
MRAWVWGSLSAFFLLLMGLALAQNNANTTDASAVIQFLNQTISWYRELSVQRSIAEEPSEILTVNDNKQVADQVVRQAFEYARAAADLLSKQNQNPTQDQQSTASQAQSLQQLSAKLDAQVRELQGELDSLHQKLETATGKKRRDLQTLIAETQSELDLTNARRDAIRSMVEFVNGASATGLGATGLRAQVEALARSAPADLSQPGNGQNNSSGAHNASASPAVQKAEPTGIWGLSADLFALSSKRHLLEQSIQDTDQLINTTKQLRAPLINQLRELSKQGDTLATAADTADPATLAQQKKQLDALTAQFKQISAAVLPLSKMGILLGIYKNSLSTWDSTLKARYRSELKSLLVRLAILGAILLLVFGVAELWRRTIYRYVHDPRRRYQFLLLRKIVLYFVVALVIAFAFASQLGSVATFAGLITAGVAVALQNVILSVAGYFFLIGRFGIRVGDRVQIGDVTGEVVEIGLVRLHLMELGKGVPIPTGRVVAFSNSIVFQPTAGLFKQIPGTNFGWHEITLTLSPDSDYHLVEERLMQVVENVFSEYRDNIEQQRRYVERILNTASVSDLRPHSHLRFTQAGLEAVIRFPVDLNNSAEIDDKVTRELLKAIEQEPKLKLVGSGTPSIRLRTDLAPTGAAT